MWNTKACRIQVKLNLTRESSSICNNWQLCCLRTPGLPGGIYKAIINAQINSARITDTSNISSTTKQYLSNESESQRHEENDIDSKHADHYDSMVQINAPQTKLGQVYIIKKTVLQDHNIYKAFALITNDPTMTEGKKYVKEKSKRLTQQNLLSKKHTLETQLSQQSHPSQAS